MNTRLTKIVTELTRDYLRRVEKQSENLKILSPKAQALRRSEILKQVCMTHFEEIGLEPSSADIKHLMSCVGRHMAEVKKAKKLKQEEKTLAVQIQPEKSTPVRFKIMPFHYLDAWRLCRLRKDHLLPDP